MAMIGGAPQPSSSGAPICTTVRHPRQMLKNDPGMKSLFGFWSGKPERGAISVV
jgi:hypothetical protein